MAKYRVQGPDGSIHLIEGPDDATPEEIETFAAQSISSQGTMGKAEAFGSSAMRGVPLGTDIASGAAALYGKAFGGIPLKEGYDLARQSFLEDQSNAKREHPKTALAGNLTGAVGSSFMLPAKALQAPSMAGRALKGAGVAFGYGAAEGLNEGDTLSERTGSAIQQGVVSAPFGAGASVATDLAVRGAGVVSRQAGPLVQKVTKYLDRRNGARAASGNRNGQVGQGADDTLAAIQRPLQRQVTADLSQELPIPLTQGNLTQSPKAQALEYGAAAGNYGDEAQRMVLETREIQSNAAKGALAKAAGSEIDNSTRFEAAGNIKNIVSDAYKAAKQKTRKAYGDVAELQAEQPLKVGAEVIRDNFVPEIQGWARAGGKAGGTGFDLRAPEMANAKRIYDEAASVAKMKKINAVNWSRMEQWRGRAGQALQAARNKLQPGISDSPETVFLRGLMDRYDDFMTALPEEAIMNGDAAVLDAVSRARAARTNQGALFERNKIIMDVLDKRNITNEQLANILFSGKGKSYRPESAADLQKIMKAAGDKSDEVLSAAKAGIYSKILKNSLDAKEIKGGQSVEEMVSFDKLTASLKELINESPTLFKTLHTPEEQVFVKNTLEAAQRIKSNKPGTKNYSNSAYTILNFLREISPSATKVGILGQNAESALKSLGEGSATFDLQKSLAPVLKETSLQLNGPSYKFFERFAPGAATAITSNPQTREGLRVIVHPDKSMSPMSRDQFESGQTFQ